MTGLVTRPDLTTRTALSKSEISTGEWCGIQGFYARTQPRKWNVTPEMTFGSAIDACVELAVKALRAGQAIPHEIFQRVGAEIAVKDDNPVDLDELTKAMRQFENAVAPMFDWSNALLQHTISVEIDGLGACEGHPDIICDDLILDVKAKDKSVNENAIRFSSELPFYAVIRMRETGDPITRIGYLVWVRTQSPKWQAVTVDVTDDVLAEGMARARRQVNLRRLIDTVASRGADPAEFFKGPAFDSKCLTCAWADICETGQRRLRVLAPQEEREAA